MKCPRCSADNPDSTRYCGECGSALVPVGTGPESQTMTIQQTTRELSTGATFAGRYQIIEELGKGGMGRVYKVFDMKIKEKIALKILKPEIASDRDTIERFGNELKFARRIRHKNVCQMFDLGEAEGAHFITMEYVPGEDLKSMIRMSKQLGIRTAVHIAAQIAEGLVEAHRLGIVHRDLKPSNIIIDREGSARIMDFGIARSLVVKGITGVGVVIGTPEYMSPEQIEGQEIDQRSDLYSLGVVIYEMVTGRVPFEGDTSFVIGMKHKSEIPRDPRGINARIPEDLSGLIMKCLEKDREKRYQNAQELIQDLKRVEAGLTGEETEFRRIETRPAKKKTAGFPIKKLLIPGTAVVVIGVAALLWLFLLRPKEGPPVKDQENRETALEVPALETQKPSKPQTKKETFKAPLAGSQGAAEKERIQEKPKVETRAEAKPLETAKAEVQKRTKTEEFSPDLVTGFDRESALLGKARVTAAKSRAQAKGLDDKNLLYAMALTYEKDAEAAISKLDFFGAKACFGIVENAYRLSLQGDDPADCAKSFQQFLRGLRSKLEKSEMFSSASSFAQPGIKLESQGDALMIRGDYAGATRCFIQAGFSYERIRLLAVAKEKKSPSTSPISAGGALSGCPPIQIAGLRSGRA
jgi:serine/threonine protein kinase